MNHNEHNELELEIAWVFLRNREKASVHGL